MPDAQPAPAPSAPATPPAAIASAIAASAAAPSEPAAPAEAAPTTETPAPVADPAPPAPPAQPAAPEAPKADAARFASMAKREAELVKKDQALKVRASELEKAQAEATRFAELRALANTDPLKAAEALGLSYEKLTEQRLKASADPAVIAQQAIEKLKAELAEKETREKEAAATAEKTRLEQQQAAAITAFRGEIADFLTKNAADYELTNAGYELTQHPDAASLVFQVCDEYFRTHQKVLSVKEAADLTEQWFEKKATTLTATKKVSAKLQPVPAAPPAPSPEAAAPTAPRSLTNDVGASLGPTPTAPVPFRRKSESDVIREALAKWDETAAKTAAPT